jgi:hypothetical protein
VSASSSPVLPHDASASSSPAPAGTRSLMPHAAAVPPSPAPPNAPMTPTRKKIRPRPHPNFAACCCKLERLSAAVSCSTHPSRDPDQAEDPPPPRYVACSCKVERLGTSAPPRRCHFAYLGSPLSDPAHPRLDPVHHRHLISAPPRLHLASQCSAPPGLCIFEGESIREWLFFDKPRRAFDSGNW